MVKLKLVIHCMCSLGICSSLDTITFLFNVFILCERCSDWVSFLPQGIRFLIDSSLLKNTSDDIAQFLYKGEGLNKTAIGDYLGER